jgi:hypothetical protein
VRYSVDGKQLLHLHVEPAAHKSVCAVGGVQPRSLLHCLRFLSSFDACRSEGALHLVLQLAPVALRQVRVA